MKVLLIAGHGQGDAGAVQNGLKEADLTREQTTLLQKSLIARGIQADVFDYTKSMCKHLRAGGSYNFRGYDYVVEIHFNSAGGTKNDGKTTGAEVYVHPKEKTVTAEESILEEIAKIGFKNRGVKVRDNLLVMNECKGRQGVSYALIEVCFISDIDDVLLYRATKANVADAIAEGIAKGYGVPKCDKEEVPQSGKLPYHDEVQRRFGFDNNTMDYLSAYKWAKPLLEKLATRG